MLRLYVLSLEVGTERGPSIHLFSSMVDVHGENRKNIPAEVSGEVHLTGVPNVKAEGGCKQNKTKFSSI
jgi:hypothetical protein